MSMLLGERLTSSVMLSRSSIVAYFFCSVTSIGTGKEAESPTVISNDRTNASSLSKFFRLCASCLASTYAIEGNWVVVVRMI